MESWCSTMFCFFCFLVSKDKEFSKGWCLESRGAGCGVNGGGGDHVSCGIFLICRL